MFWRLPLVVGVGVALGGCCWSLPSCDNMALSKGPISPMSGRDCLVLISFLASALFDPMPLKRKTTKRQPTDHQTNKQANSLLSLSLSLIDYAKHMI